MAKQWYPFYVGDYAGDTAHLSMLEHGAYRLLLDYYYSTQKPLPKDSIKLYRICRARTQAERKAVMSAALQFFIEDGLVLRNKKCDSEITKQLNFSNSQSAKAMLRHSHGNAGDMPARATTTTTTTKYFLNGNEKKFEVPEKITDEQKAEAIRFHLRIGVGKSTRYGPDDFEWLKNYELKEGLNGSHKSN